MDLVTEGNKIVKIEKITVDEAVFFIKVATRFAWSEGPKDLMSFEDFSKKIPDEIPIKDVFELGLETVGKSSKFFQTDEKGNKKEFKWAVTSYSTDTNGVNEEHIYGNWITKRN